MKPKDFLKALIAARGLSQDVESLPGAYVHRSVVKHTAELRDLLSTIADLPSEVQSSFIKSLALYEQTVGGLGSPTLLFRAFEVIKDPDHELFDWVLTNTISYAYYAGSAKSYAEIQDRKVYSLARAKNNIDRETQREAVAKARRAKKASGNLFNAIRRGDIKAVEGLLRQGAQIDTLSSDGLSATDYAEKVGHPAIAQLIKDWRIAP